MQRARNDGFTLIELSIVLVIIGLIVGGVLVGRDLIEAASIRKQISQIQEFNTGANAFRLKYGFFPGDLPAAYATEFGFNAGNGCTGAQGARDGNDLLDGNATPNIYKQGGELILFWQDLSAAGLIKGSYPNGSGGIGSCTGYYVVSGSAMGEYYPAAVLGGNNFVYVYEANGYNWFGISGISVVAGGSPASTTPLTTNEAFIIDGKIDDGLPESGNVQANFLGNTSAVAVAWAPNRDSASNPADTSSTCFVYNYNNLPAHPTHYSTMIDSGSDSNCVLSFRFQ